MTQVSPCLANLFHHQVIMVTGDHPITVQAILILDSDPEWEMAKSTDEHQKRLHFTKEEWAMSVEGRHQRQNVENVKLDVMPSL